MNKSTLHVLISTPYGEGGKGGIDRMMDGLRMVLNRHCASDVACSFGISRGKGHIFWSPFYLTYFIIKIVRLRFKKGRKLLHLNLSSYGSTWRKLICARIAAWLDIRYVIHLHSGSYPLFYESVRKPVQKEIANMFDNASCIIVLGNFWKQFVINHFQVTPDKVQILANASRQFDLSLKKENDEVVILFLGKVSKKKGINQLLKALHLLDKSIGWKAIIAGNGALGNAQILINKYELKDKINMLGWCTDEMVEVLLLGADILVLPSFSENLPMSIVEGMAAGLAIIATPVGAVEDIIIDRKTGLLIPPGDSESLADALHVLIKDKQLRLELGNAAVAFHSENLEINKYAQALLKLWRDTCC